MYDLALAAGMPSRILDPYMRYIDNLKVRYQIGKAIGIWGSMLTAALFLKVAPSQ